MASLDALRAQIRNRATFAVNHASGQLESVFRSTSPRATGLLQSKTTVDARGLQATAKAATDYASYVRTPGTRPHTIRPRRKKVLSFYWPKAGRVVFLPRVNHPGYRGSGWWDQGLAKWQDYLRDGLRRAPS